MLWEKVWSICFFVFQYDFVSLLDRNRLISKEKRALSDADVWYAHLARTHNNDLTAGARHTRSVSTHEASFIQYLDMGIWHVAFYNDGRNTEQVTYNTVIIGESLMDTRMDGWSRITALLRNENTHKHHPTSNWHG